MPELPEIETIARGMEPAVGRRIVAVETGPHGWVRCPPPSPAEHLLGRRLAGIRRIGKQLRMDLEPAGEIVLRLGMSGRVTWSPPAEEPAPHTHLRLRFEGRPKELRFTDARRFGGLWIRLGQADAAPRAPGPDALTMGLAEFRELMRRPRQVKALLLDQDAIAGVGKIYADEALFTARIHPLRPAARVSAARVAELHRALRRVLQAAIRAGGSSFRDYRDTGGGMGGFQVRHRVYGREGQPCARCGAAIRRIQAAGRSSHVCLRCQRAPR